jgi:penicillin amidase
VSRDERLSIPGLTAPVRIGVDRWGVPHITAENEADLFFAQGFNAARDRLWQIDLWRKRGLGLLAADFGAGFVAQDRAARLFLYRGDMDAEWAAYGTDARAICQAFTAGINAYVDLVRAEPRRLPPEFGALGTRPSTWRPEDVVRVRTHGAVRNALSEILRANVMAGADARRDLLRMNLEPDIVPRIAEGLDLTRLPPDVLDVYRLAVAPASFSRDRLHASRNEVWEWARVSPQGDVIRDVRAHGSNNWAVHGSRTATGRPILASDPHRPYTLPSVRYLVHLTAPGIDVIGATDPAFPGVAIGHNGRVAFGLTLFLGPDQEDVYVYETKSEDAGAYRYGGGWESMRHVGETIEIKGEASQSVDLKFTRHGPVVWEGAGGLAVAVRSVWFEPGTAPYGASLTAMRARDVDEFRRAMRRWGVPAVNQVCADSQGNIAWITAGLNPIRPNWDGLLPVPGDGRYEWKGFLDPARLPASRNPPDGFVASANAMNLPRGWPREPGQIGYEWDDRSRADRIAEVLSGDRAHSLAASCALQADVVSLPARRLKPIVAALSRDDPDAAAAIALLRDWDGHLRATSGPAALFEVWWGQCLRPALLARLVPDAAIRNLLLPGDIESILGALERPDDWFDGGDAVRARDALILSTLGDAFRRCVVYMGPETESWSWGRLHQCGFDHPLSACLDPSSAPWSVEPLPVGGSDSTVMKASYRPSDCRVVMGASVRMVVDVGEWDQSLWTNAPGQSGDPRSPHYADLAERWASGKYVPMLYSASAVDQATEVRIVLVPSGGRIR